MKQKFILVGFISVILFNLYLTLETSDNAQYLMLVNVESLAQNEDDEKNIQRHELKRQLCPDGKSFHYICSYTNNSNDYCDSREKTECPEEEEEEIDDEIIWDDDEEDYGICPVTEGEHWWETDSSGCTSCVCCGYIQGYI